MFEIIHTDLEDTEKITETWCFAEAMKLCPNQYVILRDYDRYLRYTNDVERSMLEKVVQLRNTIFAIHHLALTIKRMVEVANPRQKFGGKIFSIHTVRTRLNSQNMTYVAVMNPACTRPLINCLTIQDIRLIIQSKMKVINSNQDLQLSCIKVPNLQILLGHIARNGLEKMIP